MKLFSCFLLRTHIALPSHSLYLCTVSIILMHATSLRWICSLPANLMRRTGRPAIISALTSTDSTLFSLFLQSLPFLSFLLLLSFHHRTSCSKYSRELQDQMICTSSHINMQGEKKLRRHSLTQPSVGESATAHFRSTISLRTSTLQLAHTCNCKCLCVIYGCSQPRELWFIDFNHVK